MPLHTVAVHDDDWATAGTDIAAADFIDGEDTVQDRNGVLPVLRDVEVSKYDTVAASVRSITRAVLQPVNWPESRRITRIASVIGDIQTDSAAATNNGGYFQRWPWFRGLLNLPLPKTLSWVNPGDSQVLASTASEDAQVWLHMTYGAPNPVPFGGRRPLVRKAAGGDNTADVWSGTAAGAGGFDEKLDDETGGLDSSLRYRLAALGGEPQAAADDILMGIRWMGGKGNITFPAVAGPGSVLDAILHQFTYDTAPDFEASTAVRVQTLAAVAHTPVILMEFVEMSSAQGAGSTPVSPGAGGGAGPALGGIIGGLLGSGFGGFGR